LTIDEIENINRAKQQMQILLHTKQQPGIKNEDVQKAMQSLNEAQNYKVQRLFELILAQ